jgi:hypothetical protein
LTQPATAMTFAKTITTATVGLKAPHFIAEYVFIKSSALPQSLVINGSSVIVNAKSPIPTQIFTTTTYLYGLSVTAAVRHYEDILFQKYTEFHFAMTKSLSSRFTAGYYYNYLPGAHTLGLQFLL